MKSLIATQSAGPSSGVAAPERNNAEVLPGKMEEGRTDSGSRPGNGRPVRLRGKPEKSAAF